MHSISRHNLEERGRSLESWMTSVTGKLQQQAAWTWTITVSYTSALINLSTLRSLKPPLFKTAVTDYRPTPSGSITVLAGPVVFPVEEFFNPKGVRGTAAKTRP